MFSQKVQTSFVGHFFYRYHTCHIIISHPLHLIGRRLGTFTQHDLEHAEMANMKDEALQKDLVNLDSLIL